MPADTPANQVKSQRQAAKAGPGQNKSPAATRRPSSNRRADAILAAFMVASSGSTPSPTRPATRLTASSARLILAGLAALLIAGLATRIPQQPVSSTPEKGDAGFYQAVARRLQGGEAYYSAYGTELRLRRYPAASTFNWRTPLLLHAYATAPRSASLLLISLGALSILATLLLLRKAPPESTVLGIVLQVGAASSVVIVNGSVTVPEVWLGYLLFGSILAYYRGWNVTAAIIGIGALFIRELAAPYCIACTLMALHHRRMAELGTWLAGVAAYTVYFGWHVMSVAAHSLPGDIAHQNSWIQFGGLPFVLGTMSFNGWFAVSQPWGPSIGLVLIIAAAWARSAPIHLRVCCVTYAGFFSVAGQPFNQNWGLAASPAWAVACAYGVSGLHRLIRSAKGPTG